MNRSAKTKILFLCTGNSCRSQMAEGFAKALRSDAVEAWSAGTAPKGIDPRAVKVMAEAGIDLSGQGSKSVQEVKDVSFDYVVTLCGHARETCPVFPGRAHLVHRGFDDPPQLAASAATEEAALAHYRRVRDEIKKFARGLPGNLAGDGVEFALNL